MPNRGHGRLKSQVDDIRRQQQAEPQMPFADILSPQQVQGAIAKCGRPVRHCLFSPLVTMYAFLAQVLNADPCCRQATAQLLAWQGLHSEGEPPKGSVDTGPYCKARARLPESLPASLTREVGRDLQQRCGPGKLLQGRPIKIVDGSTSSMPDTPENQAEYPQARTQKAGLGFPVLRFVLILSLQCGVVCNAAIGPYLGKRTGETALLRALQDEFVEGDVVLGDRYFCSYWQIASFRRQGVDCVLRMHQQRRIDFRKGRSLGHWDHVVTWPRPDNPPEWMSQEEYQAMPAELEVREVRRRVAIKGFRVKALVLATTLLDAELYPAAELVQAFRARWHAELDLRSIKSAMKMDVLRCKTPSMVRKELWMHLLAYNLVRTVMAQAAKEQDRLPREISFTAAMQLMRALAPVMAMLPPKIAQRMHQILLEALGKEVVGDRLDRYEPRAVKRRPKPHRLLNEPRDKARRRMEKNAK